MRNISLFLLCLFIFCCAKGKEKKYIGSTAANNVVKSFLGIPLTDSIDFVRWNLTIEDDRYELQCNYGIGKQNTNGFIDGGKHVVLRGSLKKDKHYLHLQNGNKTLNLAELNDDLLHLLTDDNNLLTGNGGWSYTLNNSSASVTDKFYINTRRTALDDSIVFQGRTPCGVPGVVAPGKECIKLKWRIVLYPPAEKGQPAKFKIPGSPWYKEGGKTGTWQIITGKDGRVIYQLKDDKENDLVLYLLKLDENVLIFTDAGGKLLVGNEDFSYTISRK